MKAATLALSLTLATGAYALDVRSYDPDSHIAAPEDIRAVIGHAIQSCQRNTHYFCEHFMRHIKNAEPLVMSSDFVYINCPTRVADIDLCTHAMLVYQKYVKKAGLNEREVKMKSCTLLFQFFIEEDIMMLRHWTVQC
jgi:hypothetical protein